jgi:hypothetical protein
VAVERAARRRQPVTVAAMSVSERVAVRVRADFGAREAGEALRELAGTETGNQDAERVHAAVVLAAGGSLGQLKRLVALSHVDWRDVLVAGGLGNGDWPEVLARELGR